MNNTFPYWQFNNGKWLTGKISSFDLDAQGLFLQFCMAAWEGHGKFNICTTSLSMRFRKPPEWINTVVSAMIDVGIIKKDDNQYHIQFIDDQLAELMDIRQKRSMAGKASAQARIADVPPTPPSNKPPENKEEKSKEEKRRVLKSVQQVLNKCSTSVEFSTFWQAYPRKDGKAKAFESWEKHGCSAILPKILETIEKYKKTEQWQDKKYIPMPSTWLNQGRWEDEPTANTTSGGNWKYQDRDEDVVPIERATVTFRKGRSVSEGTNPKASDNVQS